MDNNTFPQQKFPLIAPESLSLLTNTLTLGSVDGLLCFYGDVDSNTRMTVILNPTVRKSVGIVIPIPKAGYTVVGFGVCHDASDPKLVKITVHVTPSMWEVEVFTLSTCIWKTAYMGALFKSCDLTWIQVFIDGVIYLSAYDVSLDQGSLCNTVISFDLKSEKFGEVGLPESLLHAHPLNVTKVNESLGLLEYYDENEMSVCGVWMRKDGANNPFTKIYTIKVEGKWYNRVLGFRNNGEVVMELQDDDNYKESRIVVYEPLSGHINDVGINGKRGTLYASSYMETLLLLDEADSIIH
ncbi:putative pentatricopeptide repeat-containing protein [Tanacetum coccineum]